MCLCLFSLVDGSVYLTVSFCTLLPLRHPLAHKFQQQLRSSFRTRESSGLGLRFCWLFLYLITFYWQHVAFAICILNWQSIHSIDSLRAALVLCDQFLELPTYCVIANLCNVFWWRFKAHCYDTKHAIVYFELYTNIY